MPTDYRKLYAVKERYKRELLKVNPNLDNGSGIYIFTRMDENGFKYAYVGQAVRITDRLISHMEGFQQHIDRSIKKHKLYSPENIYGWKVGFIHIPPEKLDEAEKYYIKQYANNGYQLRNVSLGGQGEGRNMISDTKPSKGYRDGIAQGRKTMARELKHIIDTHLEITLRKPSKVSKKALIKFNALLSEGGGEEREDGGEE